MPTPEEAAFDADPRFAGILPRIRSVLREVRTTPGFKFLEALEQEQLTTQLMERGEPSARLRANAARAGIRDWAVPDQIRVMRELLSNAANPPNVEVDAGYRHLPDDRKWVVARLVGGQSGLPQLSGLDQEALLDLVMLDGPASSHARALLQEGQPRGLSHLQRILRDSRRLEAFSSDPLTARLEAELSQSLAKLALVDGFGQLDSNEQERVNQLLRSHGEASYRLRFALQASEIEAEDPSNQALVLRRLLSSASRAPHPESDLVYRALSASAREALGTLFASAAFGQLEGLSQETLIRTLSGEGQVTDQAKEKMRDPAMVGDVASLQRLVSVLDRAEAAAPRAFEESPAFTRLDPLTQAAARELLARDHTTLKRSLLREFVLALEPLAPSDRLTSIRMVHGATQPEHIQALRELIRAPSFSALDARAQGSLARAVRTAGVDPRTRANVVKVGTSPALGELTVEEQEALIAFLTNDRAASTRLSVSEALDRGVDAPTLRGLLSDAQVAAPMRAHPSFGLLDLRTQQTALAAYRQLDDAGREQLMRLVTHPDLRRANELLRPRLVEGLAGAPSQPNTTDLLAVLSAGPSRLPHSLKERLLDVSVDTAPGTPEREVLMSLASQPDLHQLATAELDALLRHVRSDHQAAVQVADLLRSARYQGGASWERVKLVRENLGKLNTPALPPDFPLGPPEVEKDPRFRQLDVGTQRSVRGLLAENGTPERVAAVKKVALSEGLVRLSPSVRREVLATVGRNPQVDVTRFVELGGLRPLVDPVKLAALRHLERASVEGRRELLDFIERTPRLAELHPDAAARVLSLQAGTLDVERRGRLVAQRMVERGGSADIRDVQAVAEELGKLSPTLLTRAEAANVRVVAAREMVTDYLTSLGDQKPRGWPEGTTWAEVLGVQSGGELVVSTRADPTDETGQRRYVPPEGVGHGAVDLVQHEFGHAVDVMRALGTSSEDPEFIAAYEADRPNLEREGMEYLLQPGKAGREECFAEMVAQYASGKPDMPFTFPALHAFFMELEARW